jgi:predicted permease
VDSGVHEPLEQILTLLVSPPAARYSHAASQVSFFDRALENVRAVPGVTGAAFADSLAPVYWTNGDTFHIPGRPWSQERFPSAPLPTVSAGYFSTMGVPVLRGRTFDQHDAAKSALVAVVSETFVNRYFPVEDPIGQFIAPSSPQMKQPLYRIVGVVGDVRFSGLQSPPEPVWYSALAQGPDIPMFLFVRTARPIEGTLRAVEQAVRNVDAGVIFSHERTLADVVHEAVAQPRLRAGLLVAFAAVALLLAAIGTYGLVAYSVAQRTQEIGVRMALGATPRDIARLVLGEAGQLVVLGIAIGVPAAALGARTLRSLLFATQPTDLPTYCIVIAILALAVAWAASGPVRRAARIDPLMALRAD